MEELFDLCWLQTLGGGGDVLRSGLSAQDARAALQAAQADAAAGELGAGVVVYLRPAVLPPLLPELPPELREAGWSLEWAREREKAGEPSFRCVAREAVTRWLATPEMAIDAAWHIAEPDHERLEAEERARLFEADAAALRRALYAADRELETLYGSIADHADAPMWQETPRYQEIHAILDATESGAALLKELDKAQTAERAWTEIGAEAEARATALRDVLIHGLGIANEIGEGERWAAWRLAAQSALRAAEAVAPPSWSMTIAAFRAVLLDIANPEMTIRQLRMRLYLAHDRQPTQVMEPPEIAASINKLAAPPTAPTEFRKDGWPLCPLCGEDELWSPFTWDGEGEKPPMEAWLAAGLSCYKCGWSSRKSAGAVQSQRLVTDQGKHERLAEGGERDAELPADHGEELE